jgi:hypothetical protein
VRLLPAAYAKTCIFTIAGLCKLLNLNTRRLAFAVLYKRCQLDAGGKASMVSMAQNDSPRVSWWM